MAGAALERQLRLEFAAEKSLLQARIDELMAETHQRIERAAADGLLSATHNLTMFKEYKLANEALREQRARMEALLADATAELAAHRTTADADRRVLEGRIANAESVVSSLTAALAEARAVRAAQPVAPPPSLTAERDALLRHVDYLTRQLDGARAETATLSTALATAEADVRDSTAALDAVILEQKRRDEAAEAAQLRALWDQNRAIEDKTRADRTSLALADRVRTLQAAAAEMGGRLNDTAGWMTAGGGGQNRSFPEPTASGPLPPRRPPPSPSRPQTAPQPRIMPPGVSGRLRPQLGGRGGRSAYAAPPAARWPSPPHPPDGGWGDPEDDSRRVDSDRSLPRDLDLRPVTVLHLLGNSKAKDRNGELVSLERYTKDDLVREVTQLTAWRTEAAQRLRHLAVDVRYHQKGAPLLKKGTPIHSTSSRDLLGTRPPSGVSASPPLMAQRDKESLAEDVVWLRKDAAEMHAQLEYMRLQRKELAALAVRQARGVSAPRSYGLGMFHHRA